MRCCGGNEVESLGFTNNLFLSMVQRVICGSRMRHLEKDVQVALVRWCVTKYTPFDADEWYMFATVTTIGELLKRGTRCPRAFPEILDELANRPRRNTLTRKTLPLYKTSIEKCSRARLRWYKSARELFNSNFTYKSDFILEGLFAPDFFADDVLIAVLPAPSKNWVLAAVEQSSKGPWSSTLAAVEQSSEDRWHTNRDVEKSVATNSVADRTAIEVDGNNDSGNVRPNNGYLHQLVLARSAGDTRPVFRQNSRSRHDEGRISYPWPTEDTGLNRN